MGLDRQDEDASLGLLDISSGYIPGMALKAIDILGVPGILARHSEPLTAEEILLEIPNVKDKLDKVAAATLRSLLAVLVHHHVFTESVGESGESPRYGLTDVSKLLMDDVGSKLTKFKFFYLLETQMKTWMNIHEAVLDSKRCPFEHANNMTFWEVLQKDQKLATRFHEDMEDSVLEHAKVLQMYDGFDGIEALVDVGGGTGGLIDSIVQARPHIRGINFDTPHVIASAPKKPGIVYISGDFFVSIPKGDAIIMKWILHDWNDEQCIKILQNCRKALPESGKVIICDQVLEPPSKSFGLKCKVGHKLSLAVLAMCGGRERYAEDWAELISAAGFARHRIIQVPNSCIDIIEAFMS